MRPSGSIKGVKHGSLGLVSLVVVSEPDASGFPYSLVGRSKHAEYESVCHFDVLLKFVDLAKKTSCQNYLINLSINSQKTYLLLHFSTDFNKRGLK